MKNFYETFKELYDFKLSNKSFIYENGYTESFFGRRRYLDKSEYTKFFNSKIQMTSSDICLRAIHFLQEQFKKNKLESKVIPYIVFDNLGFDIKKEELEQTKEIIKNCMEKLAPGNLSDYVNFPVKFIEGDTL
jgi:DNA polymerase I-like protein with 3'-5' exonuclease and polymerase domains